MKRALALTALLALPLLGTACGDMKDDTSHHRKLCPG